MTFADAPRPEDFGRGADGESVQCRGRGGRCACRGPGRRARRDGTAPAAEIVARASQVADFAAPPATPRAECGPGSAPAPGLQGRVTAEAPDDGYHVQHRARRPRGQHRRLQGRALRRRRRAPVPVLRHDAGLPAPRPTSRPRDGSTGVAVVDVSDPAKPVRTETLVTPAMQSPHESLLVNQSRGLLAAVMGNPTTDPGVIDIYDLNADCRHPQLLVQRARRRCSATRAAGRRTATRSTRRRCSPAR